MVRTRAKAKEEDKVKGGLGAYNSMMAQYPLLMNEVQAGIITSSAVACSNMIAEDDNIMEVVIMTIVSLTFITPILLSYYGWLGKQNFGLITSIIVDQLIFSPVFTTGILMWRGVVSGIFASGTLDVVNIMALPGDVLPIIPEIMKKSWGYWIPIRLLILKFVPPMYHVVVGSACSFIWQIIMALSLKK